MKSIRLLPNDPEACEKIFRKATGGNIEEVILTRNRFSNLPRVVLKGTAANGLESTVMIDKGSVAITNTTELFRLSDLKHFGYYGI